MGQKSPDLSGRGARTNRAGRFEALSSVAFDDGWEPDEEPPKLDTVITQEIARTIISRNDSPDLHFDQSINTYRGCEHGCIYCYARPNHAYAGLSPGLDFETRLFAKTNAPALLQAELKAASYRPTTIVLGGVTDCYQPAERERRITRGVLEVLQRHRHPVAIVTKSALVQRDIDILGEMAQDRLVKVGVSVTTLDRKLARAMEPRAAAPHRRLETIAALTAAGIPVTVMTAPMIPAVNDRELETLLEAGRDAGAREASYVVLRLPLEISELFQEWLAAHFPDRAAHVMSLVRQMRGGKDYESAWGLRQKGTGPYAKLIADRFRRACERLGLNTVREGLDVTRFHRPGDQMRLF
ncbi:MAG: PA0069 family radical SAM protein [Hyphomonadaceae bacterium]